MSSIVVRVETNQVAVENTKKQGFSDGQNPVDFATREWCMQEETNLDVLLGGANFLSQHFWQEHQMVVVNPDQISILYIFSHRLCEQAVDILVCFPVRLVEGNLSRVVMKEGPEDGV